MQTFLPYPEFARSAAVLDSPRLGKQRVETLQLLRALVFPSYGWQRHPAKVMWEGYVPALAAYGLAMVDAWTERGAADSTRAQIAEFAPEVVGVAQDELVLPSWLGNEALHVSHQSNLIRKDAEFYSPRFPGVPGDLDYFWPGADPDAHPLVVSGAPLMVFRPRDDAQFEEWMTTGSVTMTDTSPRGSGGPKWVAQRALFSELPVGTPVAVLSPSGEMLMLGELGSKFRDRRVVQFAGELRRSDFPYPALLQDPRTLFETVGPASL